MITTQASVAVAGAGPAGAVAALYLARAGFRVQIIEHGLRQHPRSAETLSPEGRRELTVAGLWDRLPAGVVAPCPAVVSAWQRTEPIWRSFITNPYGCAWHVDRARFDPWLLSEAEAAGASLVPGTVAKIRRADCCWELHVRGADGQAHAATSDFLVIATGRCGFASSLGVRERIDALCLIGGLSKSPTQADDSLLVEAVPNGWWYSAPTADGRMFAAWITDSAAMEEHGSDAMSTALMHAPLTRARLFDLPAAFSVGLVSSALRPCAGEGWMAIGDAMLSRDPLSGDGLSCALRSARDAAGTFLKAREGDSTAWRAASIRGVEVIAQYMKLRNAAYTAAKHRWPAEPFWARRFGKQDTQPNSRAGEGRSF